MNMLIARLDARDRDLFMRWAVVDQTSSLPRVLWTVLTHLGGTICSVMAACAPLTGFGDLGIVGRQALATLIMSHVIVQLVKRTVGRPRPSRITQCRTLVAEPDRFSFPSGHSAAAMSVAVIYAFAFPSAGIVLLPLAVAIGASRVFLGVHYPGDVLIGQMIAVLTALVVRLV